jgi:hypothetical protein
MTGPTVRPGLELLPCPFCGSAAQLQDAYLARIMEHAQGAFCPSCMFSLPIETWNTRAALAASGIEEMRGALREIEAMDDGRKLNWGHAQDAIDIARAALSLADGMGGEG